MLSHTMQINKMFYDIPDIIHLVFLTRPTTKVVCTELYENPVFLDLFVKHTVRHEHVEDNDYFMLFGWSHVLPTTHYCQILEYNVSAKKF